MRDGGLRTRVSELWVCLSAEGAKNVSWPWLSPPRGWGSLTMAFIDKFIYMAHHFILQQLNPFDLRIDREGWWFEHSFVIVYSCRCACQQRVLKVFPGRGYLCSEDGVV